MLLVYEHANIHPVETLQKQPVICKRETFSRNCPNVNLPTSSTSSSSSLLPPLIQSKPNWQQPFHFCRSITIQPFLFNIKIGTYSICVPFSPNPLFYKRLRPMPMPMPTFGYAYDSRPKSSPPLAPYHRSRCPRPLFLICGPSSRLFLVSHVCFQLPLRSQIHMFLFIYMEIYIDNDMDQ